MRIVLYFIALVLVSSAHASDTNYGEHFKWKKRIIVLVADNQRNALMSEQVNIISAGESGLRERDVVVKQLFANEPKHAPLIKAYAVDKGFTFLLIGKDGKEKIRSNKAVNLSMLFAVIDAMPMRKIEMLGK